MPDKSDKHKKDNKDELSFPTKNPYTYAKILEELTPREILKKMQVDKSHRDLILPKGHSISSTTTSEENDIAGVVDWKKFGAKNYKDFVERTKALPKLLKNIVLDSELSLNEAEEITNLLKKSRAGREATVLPPHLCAQESYYDPFTLEVLLSDNGIIALSLGLITPNQAARMPTGDHLDSLLADNGLTALREKLITPEEAAKMPDFPHLKYLLSDNGLTALREKLITPEEAAKMPDFPHLKYLLSDNGLTALREKLITPKQAAKMPNPDKLRAEINKRLTKHAESEKEKINSAPKPRK